MVIYLHFTKSNENNRIFDVESIFSMEFNQNNETKEIFLMKIEQNLMRI